MRDEFRRTTIDILAKRVGNRCSNPQCRKQTNGPHTDDTKALNVGVAAHITAASFGGPRYEVSLTEEKRKNISNGIWLCQSCAKLVDNDEVRYTKEILLSWKQQSEMEALREIQCTSSESAAFGKQFRIATHTGEYELVSVTQCDRYGRPLAPEWLSDDPSRMASDWLVERLHASHDLRVFFDPKWCGGTWFVADLASGEGVVVNLDQLGEIMPPPPTTTTTAASEGAGESHPTKFKDECVAVIDGVRTLPLKVVFCKTTEPIPVFGSGKAQVVYREPVAVPSHFRCDADTLARVSRDWEFACSAVKAWSKFEIELLYFYQFRDDSTRELAKALYEHSQLVSRICDLRLALDPTPLSRLSRSVFNFGIVQSEYRNDPDRERQYDAYVERLRTAYQYLCEHREVAEVLIERILRIMESKRLEWGSLTPLDGSAVGIRAGETGAGPDGATDGTFDLTA